MILSIGFGAICCFVICYTCRLFWKYEIEYERKYFECQAAIQNATNTTTGIQMEQTNKQQTKREFYHVGEFSEPLSEITGIESTENYTNNQAEIENSDTE